MHPPNTSLGPLNSTPLMASRLVQPFLQGRRTWMVQSYSPDGANVKPYSLTHSLTPTCNVTRASWGPSETPRPKPYRSVQPFLHSSPQCRQAFPGMFFPLKIASSHGAIWTVAIFAQLTAVVCNTLQRAAPLHG